MSNENTNYSPGTANARVLNELAAMSDSDIEAAVAAAAEQAQQELDDESLLDDIEQEIIEHFLHNIDSEVGEHVTNGQTYREAMMLTHDSGVVLTLDDGTSIVLTIRRKS